jgi:predicted phosphodiesterase
LRLITSELRTNGRGDCIRLYFVGDIHIGARACDEQRLARDVKAIADDPSGYVVLMGDYCDFINRSDPRFNPGALADWVTMADLVDLSRTQRDRVVDALKPIAPQVLCALAGNHETAITRHYERDVYYEIVAALKEHGAGQYSNGVAMGYNGWLKIKIDRGGHVETFRLRLHHGYGGGRLAGGKALNMQREIWTHANADIVAMGHTHIAKVQPEAVQVERGGKIYDVPRWGLWTGTYLRGFVDDSPSTYSEVKGYLPLPMVGVMAEIRPGVTRLEDRIRCSTR